MKQVEFKLTEKIVEKFLVQLRKKERTPNTILKYKCDIKKLVEFANGKVITKDLLMSFKKEMTKRYKTSSVNAMIVAVNGLLQYFNRPELKLQHIKHQKRLFRSTTIDLSKEEYLKLIFTAKNHNMGKYALILQTICSTGIRVSELQAFTVEAVRRGTVEIFNKGKVRLVFITDTLREYLLTYAQQQGIKSGQIFVTRNNKSIDRTTIWRKMKSIAKLAGVSSSKVYPHSLRHLFAKTFYSVQKDLINLSGILGHSNIETTRLYILATSDECQRQISDLGLVVCGGAGRIASAG